jgi:2-octaprenyl-6-methoxyphenol hydroxylase
VALTAAEAGLPALGYVVDYGSLVGAFDAALERAGLDVHRGAHVSTIAHGPASARVEFATHAGVRECIATLVAIADGGAVHADVRVRTLDYGQCAVTALVETEAPHAHIAYERFTPSGPIALLPFGTHYAVVWTMPSSDADTLVADSAVRFAARLSDAFGDRVGRMTLAGPRAAHRLVLRIAQDVAWGRAALIGNAAQSLHPVAGQGFNVGLRDAWELATEIRRGGVADPDLLARYSARRRIDRAGAIAFTDGLVRIFSNDFSPLAVARGIGLTVLDCLPPLKNFVVRRMIFGTRG